MKMSTVKKRIMITLVSIIITIIIVGGVTYAFFYYGKTGDSNQLIVGDIYMNYTKTSANYLTINDAYPTKTFNPDNYLEFKVEGFNEYDQDVVYDISLLYGDITDERNRIDDSSLMFTLLKSLDNGETWTTVIDGKSYPMLNDRRIYVSSIPMETSTLTTHLYRLYMWVPDTVTIANDHKLGDYTFNEWENLEANIKVKVTGDFTSKNIYQEPILVMKNLQLVTDVENIKDKITSLTVSTNPIVPNNAITTIDITDETSAGPVTLYTFDDSKGNNTYSAVICGDGYIYAPADSSWLLYDYSILETVDFKKLKTDYVTDMSGFFYNCEKLQDILSLYNWNTSNVANLSMIFVNCYVLKSLDGLEKWDTSKNETLYAIFWSCHNLSDISALANWDTHNVTTLEDLFYCCYSLQSIEDVTKWDTSKVETLSRAFYHCSSLRSLNGIQYWNTANVQTLQGTFSLCEILEDIDALRTWNTGNVTSLQGTFDESGIRNVDALINWNTEKVTNMYGVFYLCPNLESIEGLQNWDTSLVEYMHAMFEECKSLQTLHGLENWDVQNVTSFGLINNNVSYGMFEGLISLTDASAINNWEMSSSANFTNMFKNTPIHPEFTNILGTWDNNGTFIPS